MQSEWTVTRLEYKEPDQSWAMKRGAWRMNLGRARWKTSQHWKFMVESGNNPSINYASNQSSKKPKAQTKEKWCDQPDPTTTKI